MQKKDRGGVKTVLRSTQKNEGNLTRERKNSEEGD